MQRYCQTWSGDNYTEWKTIRWNLRMGLGLSISGCYNVGHDVGGFAGPAPDAELLVAAKAMLKAGVKEYRRREEAARVEENKACAKQLADSQELSKQNHAKRNAEAQAERDRMNKIAEIDKWEKARQADPNCVL